MYRSVALLDLADGPESSTAEPDTGWVACGPLRYTAQITARSDRTHPHPPCLQSHGLARLAMGSGRARMAVTFRQHGRRHGHKEFPPHLGRQPCRPVLSTFTDAILGKMVAHCISTPYAQMYIKGLSVRATLVLIEWGGKRQKGACGTGAASLVSGMYMALTGRSPLVSKEAGG
jgi:hypothetical protein